VQIFGLFVERSWSKLIIMRKITLASLLLLSLSVSAEIYEGTGPNGEIVYSDRPAEGSKPVEVKGASTYKPPKYRRSTTGESEVDVAPFSYKVITITQPSDDATLFDSEGPVAVTIKLDPALREADRILLYVDGRPTGKPLHATSFSLTLEDRGEHKLLAEVQDSKGKAVGRSGSIQFYYRKHSVLFKKKGR